MNIYRGKRHYHIFQHFEIKQLFLKALQQLLAIKRPIQLTSWCVYDARWIEKFFHFISSIYQHQQQQQQRYSLLISELRFSSSLTWYALLCLMILSRWQLSLVRVLIKMISLLTKEMACNHRHLKGSKLRLLISVQKHLKRSYLNLHLFLMKTLINDICVAHWHTFNIYESCDSSLPVCLLRQQTTYTSLTKYSAANI